MRRREFIGLMAGSVVGGFAGKSFAVPPVGKMAPAFSVTLTDGRLVSLKDFKGSAILVNFWASG